MGRIQRKKAPGDKKRKKQGAAGEATAETAKSSSSGGLQSGAITEAAKGITKSAKVATRKPSAAGSAAAAKKPGEGFFAKAVQFLREVKVELKKVAWPSRKQTIGSTAVVIALVVLISLFLGVVDMGLSSLMRFVLN